jgi:hypothetical protein
MSLRIAVPWLLSAASAWHLKMRMMHSGLEKQKHNLCYCLWNLVNVQAMSSWPEPAGSTESMFVSRRRGNRRCAKARVRRLIGALYAKAPVMHPDAIAAGFGTEAVLRLWRIAIFRTGFHSGLD